MKKLVSALLVLAMIPWAATAEFVPSKRTADMLRIAVTAENIPEASGFFIGTASEAEDAPEQQEKLAICQEEIVKLAASENIESYFGSIKDPEGNEVILEEILETTELHVHEFCPLVAGEYEERYGKVAARMQFATPYKSGERVIVLVGLVHAEDHHMIDWTAYEGIGADSGAATGCIEVELDPEIVLAIQEEIALLAVVSK